MNLAARINADHIKLPIGAMLLLCLLLAAFPASLSACAMSALIATNGHFLSDFPTEGDPSNYYYFNDPWDYFGFVMANSQPYSNSDGYGTVSYSAVSTLLNDSRTWYKRVLVPGDFNQVYYTGSYLDEPQNGDMPQYDVMDRAIDCIRRPLSSDFISMSHARNATGVTMGNHPFTFNYGSRSYSFMHNGNANGARSFMIHEIKAISERLDWFETHPSNFFHDPDPYRWVDSEVLFHFIINHILASRLNTTLGIVKAMQSLRPYLSSSSYNFIMSDGTNLYAFRSTASPSYQLSYKRGPGWYGIRTGSPYADETRLQPLELVIFTPSGEQRLIRIDQYDAESVAMPSQPSSITLSPNPARTGSIITLIPEYPFASGKNPARLEIFNTKGQLQQSSDIPDLLSGAPITMELGSLSSGIYFCRIRSGDYKNVIRFSVVK